MDDCPLIVSVRVVAFQACEKLPPRMRVPSAHALRTLVSVKVTVRESGVLISTERVLLIVGNVGFAMVKL